MALAETHIGRVASISFDDFIAGKGRDLNVLLQYSLQFLFHTNALIHKPVGHQESEKL